MAQVVNTVGQPATTITNNRGVGQYGFSCQQLEIAGYVKPGTWQQFIKNGPSTLTEVLTAPGIWTGLNGIYSLDEFLNSPSAQNDAQARLMENGYNSLQAAGVITTPATQSISAVVGEIYTGSNVAVATARATLVDSVNSQVAALVTNSSQYGTQLTAQWANALPPLTSVTSNLTDIQGSNRGGVSSASNRLGTLTQGLTPALTSVKTAMDTLGKASQFAAIASSTIGTGLGRLSSVNLSNLSLNSLTSNLPSASALANQIKGSAGALAGQLQGQLAGQAKALISNAEGQAKALISNAEGQAKALLGQAQGQFNSLLTQGDSLVASVQKAAGFTNTVNRASVDVAMTKIFGSSKIPTPSFGVPDSASIAAALDISKAQGVLKNLQGQGATLLGQAQGQVTTLANQAQGQAAGLLTRARSIV
jgi:hypothetical protein